MWPDLRVSMRATPWSSRPANQKRKSPQWLPFPKGNLSPKSRGRSCKKCWRESRRKLRWQGDTSIPKSQHLGLFARLSHVDIIVLCAESWHPDTTGWGAGFRVWTEAPLHHIQTGHRGKALPHETVCWDKESRKGEILVVGMHKSYFSFFF